MLKRYRVCAKRRRCSACHKVSDVYVYIEAEIVVRKGKNDNLGIVDSATAPWSYLNVYSIVGN
jgi:hypothetical protein